jgi:hypothetical protein
VTWWLPRPPRGRAWADLEDPTEDESSPGVYETDDRTDLDDNRDEDRQVRTAVRAVQIGIIIGRRGQSRPGPDHWLADTAAGLPRPR